MNFLKRIVKKLYIFFSSNTKETNCDEIEDKKEEIIINEFKNIEFGDIIYAKRVADVELPKGHKYGPFLVIENKGNELVCLYGTSNCIRALRKYRFIIDKLKYDQITKDTLFKFKDISLIDKSSFIKKLECLNAEDMKILQKKINILGIEDDIFKKYMKKINLEEKDIFKYSKKLYLVYKIENNIITAIRITNDETNYKIISNNGIKNIDFNEIIEIKYDTCYKARDFILEKLC